MNIQIASIRLVFWSMTGFLVLLYAIWYTTTSYEDLAIWYQQINPNFYKNDQWTELFFTQDVKYFGQWYNWGIVVATFIMLWYSFKYQGYNKSAVIEFKKPKISIDIVLIFIFAMINWWFWQGKAHYATDEVFSALNFADKPLFQTISHYPLPNNHIFFNVINHWFRYFTDDLVFSGRILSGILTAFMVVNIYSFSENFIANKTTKLLIIAFLLTIFPIMGFATQARGYSLHMLLGWIAFVQLYKYGQQKEESNMMFYIFANALGMWTMPSYLYFWAGLTFGFSLKMINDGKTDYLFLVSNLKILIIVFILYLPTVTFSGWEAILTNKYVAAGQESTWSFIQSSYSNGYFVGLFNDFFGTRAYTWIGLVIIIVLLGLSWLLAKKLILVFIFLV